MLSENQTISFVIKKLSSENLDYAKQLIMFFQIDDGDENPTLPSDEYCSKMLEREDFHVIIALENDWVIGGLTAYEMNMYKLETTEMFLYEIGVEPAHRKKGVATALIEHLKKICLDKDIRIMFVGAMANNSPARKLYETTGGIGEEVIEFEYELD